MCQTAFALVPACGERGVPTRLSWWLVGKQEVIQKRAFGKCKRCADCVQAFASQNNKTKRLTVGQPSASLLRWVPTCRLLVTNHVMADRTASK
jgi:hypothetical protein